MSPKALVVQPNGSEQDPVATALRRVGFHVTIADKGQDALRHLGMEDFDLVALDLSLPDIDGLEVCRLIRARSSHVMMVLIGGGDTTDVVVGLEFGADDYVRKPFDVREIIARVRALMRRAGRKETPVIDLGRLQIDLDAHRVVKDGSEVPLSVTEFRLLVELARRADSVLSRDDLLERVWRTRYLGDSRLVDMAVKRLRQKVEDDPRDPRVVRTVRGLGYRLDTKELLPPSQRSMIDLGDDTRIASSPR